VNQISMGNEVFEGGSKEVIFKSPIVVSTISSVYFVTYDFSQFAGVGSRHGVSLSATSYFTVEVPHAVVFSSPTFVTNPLVEVQKVASLVTLGSNDLIFTQKVERVGQAQANVPFLRLNLGTDVSTARWEKLRVERGGGSQDTTKLFGRNTDVGFIRIWSDLNQNDLFDTMDLNISEANTSVVSGTTTLPAVAVSSGQVDPFWMIVASTQGFPSSGTGWVWVGGAELMSFVKAEGVCVGVSTVPAILIARQMSDGSLTSGRARRFGDGPTPRMTHAIGTTVRKVDLFNQENDNDLQATIELSAPQTVSPTPAVFFVTYDIGGTAVKNDKLALNILDKSWVGVALPSVVSGNFNKVVSKDQVYGSGQS
jgi:hypothetical protein